MNTLVLTLLEFRYGTFLVNWHTFYTHNIVNWLVHLSPSGITCCKLCFITVSKCYGRFITYYKYKHSLEERIHPVIREKTCETRTFFQGKSQGTAVTIGIYQVELALTPRFQCLDSVRSSASNHCLSDYLIHILDHVIKRTY